MGNDKKYSYVYALVDSRFPYEYRYVGITTRKLSYRLHGHLRSIEENDRRCHTYKANWMRSVISEGGKIVIMPLEEGYFSKEELFELEELWIIGLKAQGYVLTNATNGGEGRFGPMRPEVIAKMIGRKTSLETRLKMSKSHKGKKFSDSARRNMKIAAMKRASERGPYSVEDREKMSIISKEAWNRNSIDPEWVDNFKKKTSEGTKKGLADPEVRSKISKSSKERYNCLSEDDRKRQIDQMNTPEANEKAKNSRREYLGIVMGTTDWDERNLKVAEGTKEAMRRPEVREKQLQGLKNRDPMKKEEQYFKSKRTRRYSIAKKNNWVLDLSPKPCPRCGE